jgi:hypothetical protein
MTKLSQGSVMLFSLMLLICTSVPSLASAASWSPVATTHQLFSNNLTFMAHTGPVGLAGWRCAGSEFDAEVITANTIVTTSEHFSNCTGLIGFANCATTVVSTRLWFATAASTTNIPIHNIDVDVLFEGPACAADGLKVLLTGTLTGGSWNSSGNEAVYTNATGLTLHYLGVGMSSSVTATGTIRDTTNTLRMFM